MTRLVRLDTHCHLDKYSHQQARALVDSLRQSAVVVIAVSNTPSAFVQLRQMFASASNIRFALGAHPLNAGQITISEWALFKRCLSETTYIGEVGLDFSSEGIATRTQQELVFTRVLKAITGKNKVVTLHSRRAEAAVLDKLTEHTMNAAIFHWYSGPLGVLDHILEAGHYFSFNPAMIRSKKGQRIIERIPAKRALVETDGPYLNIGSRPATPLDIDLVYSYLAAAWEQPVEDVIRQIYDNFLTVLRIQHA